MSKDEAFQYLKLRNIDGEQAAQVYELVGSRIILLKYVANKVLKGTRLDSMYPYSLGNWILTFLL